MKLNNIKIANFRSAGSVSVNEVADFNVLIGKNNAGKSTILLAIEAFFSSLKEDGLIKLNPRYGRKIDFTNQILNEPISLVLTFALTEPERSTLLSDIVREAQQVRHITTAIESPLLVEVEVSITPPPDNYSYVKSVRLRGMGTNSPEDPKTLLAVSQEAARELADQQRIVSSAQQTIEEIRRISESIDSEDFNRMKSEGEHRYVRFVLARVRGGPLSPETIGKIDHIVQSNDSYAAFRGALTSIQQQIGAEVNDTLKRPLSTLLQTLSGEQPSVPGYAMRLMQAIAKTSVLYLTERREPVGRTEAKQFLDYKVTRGGPERLKQIQQKIEVLLGVTVDAFESDRVVGGERSAEIDVDQFLLEVNGSGVKEALRLILDLELKRPDILLVEEPEVHLHPALEINMMEYLREASKKCQILLTTHSTNFLDLSNAQGIYFVTRPESTVVKRIGREEAQELIPKELGIRLSSLFMFDRLVFVEGLSDELIIREFAATLDVNLSQATVGFIHLGGSRNFGYYAGEAVLSFLSKRQVKSTFLIDRDEKDDAELTRMRTAVGDRATLHVWKRRELENYLLSVGPITRYIANKMAGAGAIPTQGVTEQTVSAALGKSADELKVFTYCKKAAHALLSNVYPSLDLLPGVKAEAAEGLFAEEIKRLQQILADQQARIPSVLANSKKVIEANYAPQGWGTVVCGDIVLDETFKKFGTRYRKISDGPKLAALFAANEIDQEVVQLIRSLGSGK
jgi:putative ATP-dependent endonuclease of the OLD family